MRWSTAEGDAADEWMGSDGGEEMGAEIEAGDDEDLKAGEVGEGVVEVSVCVAGGSVYNRVVGGSGGSYCAALGQRKERTANGRRGQKEDREEEGKRKRTAPLRPMS